VTFNGDIPAADDDRDAYDVIAAIANELKALNAEMLHVHSLQITLGSPPNVTALPEAGRKPTPTP
jgi:hypothetical protein